MVYKFILRTCIILGTCSTATAKNFHPTGGPGGGCTSADFDLEETDATHRGCHKFVPRHQGELAIEIGDYIYVQVEDDDLWCEGKKDSVVSRRVELRFSKPMMKKLCFSYLRLSSVSLAFNEKQRKFSFAVLCTV